MTRMRQLAGAALVLGVALLAACRPQPATGHGEDAAGTPAAVAAAAATAFQQDLEGVWVTGENTGDDAETVFRIESTTEHGLRVVMDDTWLSGQVDDVDTDGNTLTMHLQSATGPEETITLRKVPGEGGGDGFHLRLTWGNGIAQELGFVRRLSPRDREQIAAAVANARQADALGDGPLKPDACDAEELPTLRLRKLPVQRCTPGCQHVGAVAVGDHAGVGARTGDGVEAQLEFRFLGFHRRGRLVARAPAAVEAAAQACPCNHRDRGAEAAAYHAAAAQVGVHDVGHRQVAALVPVQVVAGISTHQGVLVLAELEETATLRRKCDDSLAEMLTSF